MRRRVFLNSLSGVVFFAVTAVIAFFLSPIVVRELGNQNYGVWEILLSVLGYLQILDLGIGAAIIRYVARAAAREDDAELNRILNTSLLFLTGAGVLGLGVMAVVAVFPQHILNLRPHSIASLRFVVLFLGLNFLVQFTGTVFVAYLMGMQRHYFLNGTKTVLAVLQAVVTYFALTRWPGPGLVWLACILLGVTLTLYSSLTFWVLRTQKSLRLSLGGFSWTTVKELYAFGAKSVTLMISSRLNRQAVPIVIGWVLGAPQVVFFAIPNRLAEYASNLGVAIGFPLMPYFSALEGKHDQYGMIQAWSDLSRVLEFITLGMGVAMLLLGEPFIARWMGPSYAEGGRWIIRLLALTLIVETLAPNSSRLLIGLNRHGPAARAALVIAVAGVPVTIGLTYVAGLVGVAIAVFLGRAATRVTWFLLACSALGITPWMHLRRCTIPILPAAFCTALLLGALHHFWYPQTYPELVAQGAAGGLMYLGVTWVTALSQDERRAVMRFGGGFLTRGRGMRTL